MKSLLIMAAVFGGLATFGASESQAHGRRTVIRHHGHHHHHHHHRGYYAPYRNVYRGGVYVAPGYGGGVYYNGGWGRPGISIGW